MVSDPTGNGYESDSSGSSSSSEGLIVGASTVAGSSALVSILFDSANTCTDANRTRGVTRGGSTPSKVGNRERFEVVGAEHIDADDFRIGVTAERAPIFTSANSSGDGLHRVLGMKLSEVS
jgi:hypothetical protein